MKFTVKVLKQLTILALLGGAKDESGLYEFLHEKQPYFCDIIDEVGIDPRCYDAHRFCTLFCATAQIYAEEVFDEPLTFFPGHLIHDVCCLVAQKQELQVGKRACTYPDRIRRYVLSRLNFDEDDTSWLCTTISVFLVIIERTLIERKREKSS
jgi:hypothetical protein